MTNFIDIIQGKVYAVADITLTCTVCHKQLPLLILASLMDQTTPTLQRWDVIASPAHGSLHVLVIQCAQCWVEWEWVWFMRLYTGILLIGTQEA